MLLYSDLPSGLPTEMLIFGLLTFAPRKNPPDGGNLTLLRYHVTAFITILYFSRVCKHFFTFFYFFLKHSFKRNKMLCYRHFERQGSFSDCVSSYYMQKHSPQSLLRETHAITIPPITTTATTTIATTAPAGILLLLSHYPLSPSHKSFHS